MKFTRLLRSLTRPGTGPAQRESARRAIELCHLVLAQRGEASVAQVAAEAIRSLRSLGDGGLDRFFDGLVDEFSPDAEGIRDSARKYADDPSQVHLVQLQAAIESPRVELFRRLNMASGGTSALVDLRRQLLPTLRERPQRTAIDADLLHLLRSWFNRGFLVLQRIDWRTPALILERLIQHEAVHQIQGWGDLHRRLEADRRCYAFFHPSLPDEPLIFIEVALTRGIVASVQPLLDSAAPLADPAEADCAVFYSITNCQPGLRGVSFGNFLIKTAVEDLQREFRRIRTFATLSPLPGFLDWLAASKAGEPRSAELNRWLRRRADDGVLDDGRMSDELRREVTALGAYYLVRAKRGNEPLDSVARFHLANGARLERINWRGDTSGPGLRQSLGLSVNYVYRLADVERNHESYARTGRIVASPEVEALARSLERRQPATA